MPEGTTSSAIEAMRALTAQISQPIEALIEAHGFSLTQMSVTPDEATAAFTLSGGGAGNAWFLTLTQSVAGELAVTLDNGGEERPSKSLRILVEAENRDGLAEGVALAVSFVAFSDRFRQPA